VSIGGDFGWWEAKKVGRRPVLTAGMQLRDQTQVGGGGGKVGKRRKVQGKEKTTHQHQRFLKRTKQFRKQGG